MEKETLDLTAIIKILGDRPFPARSNFREYLETKIILEQEKERENSEKNETEIKDSTPDQKFSIKVANFL